MSGLKLICHYVGRLLLASLLIALPAVSAQAQEPPLLHSIVEVDSGPGFTGFDSSLELDARGYPVVAYTAGQSSSERELRILRCGDADCTSGNTINAIGNYYSITDPSLALDENGFPIVAYLASDDDGLKLRVLHCNDAACAGDDESIQDIAEATLFGVSLALDNSGNPVVSFAAKIGIPVYLHLLHCDDQSCDPGTGASGDSLEVVGSGGTYSSLQLDSNGFPVIAYSLGTNDLQVAHCNDPNCADGDENIGESVNWPWDIGFFNLDMVLDSDGYPVVAGRERVTSELDVVRCNDSNCADSDESVFTADLGRGSYGNGPSIALDSSGFPIISHEGDRNLRIVHCNDANCEGYDESRQTADNYKNIGGHTSLALDADGYPVVSYHESRGLEGSLRIIHCRDVDCTTQTRIIGLDVAPDDPNNVLDYNGPDGFYDPDKLFEIAILGEADFDATQIDPAELRLNAGGFYQHSLPFDEEGQFDDINGDGIPDFTIRYTYDRVSLRCAQGNQYVHAVGNLLSGAAFRGSDRVTNVAPCPISFYIDDTLHPHHNGLCWLPGYCDNQNDIVRVQIWDTQSVDLATLRFGRSGAGIQPGSPYYVPGPDNNYDGVPDSMNLMADFLMGDTGITCTDTEVVMSGLKSNGDFRGGKNYITTDCEAGAHCH